MLKAGLLKKFLKEIVFPVFTWINNYCPKDQKVVLLYTANKGISFSLIPFRKYLLDNHFDSKYKIYCGIEHIKYAEDEPRVKFVTGIFAILVFLRAGHVFYTAGQIPIKPSRKQIVFHLRHGNANFKTTGLLTNINNGDEFFFTKMIASSEYFIPIMAAEYNCPKSCIAVAGDPMCDALLTAPRNKYDFSKYSKLLVWFPTFRQSDYLGYDDSSMETLIPLFNDDDYYMLNNALAKYNIFLIAKLHPAQTTPYGVQRHFSHLSVYSHDEFMKSDYDMYNLMAQSDGMIGDYSSASLQYLLVDRPQAYVIPDLEDILAHRPFEFETPEDYMGGHIIKTKDEFWTFLDDFANDRDIYADKRHWVCDQIYKYKDANSCKRIVELSGLTLE